MSAYFTKQALKKLKKEIEYLETVKRKEIATKLKKAVAFGDLSENAAYDDAQVEQGLLEEQIARLKREVKNATISSFKNNGLIQLGSVVWIKKINSDKTKEEEEEKEEEKKITICSPNETDFTQGKISNNSPLGQALLGKKIGDTVFVKTIAKNIKYKITKII